MKSISKGIMKDKKKEQTKASSLATERTDKVAGITHTHSSAVLRETKWGPPALSSFRATLCKCFVVFFFFLCACVKAVNEQTIVPDWFGPLEDENKLEAIVQLPNNAT